MTVARMRPPAGSAPVGTTVGIDLVEIRRIERLLSRPGAAERLLTAGEQAYCARRGNRPARVAARLAAKEAVLKAFGTGLGGGIHWTDVEVVNDAAGRPRVQLHGAAAAHAARHGLVTLDVSLSHGCDMAVAQAVAVWSPRDDRDRDAPS
jgi:holo-[acyl-carrier protein] synthase